VLARAISDAVHWLHRRDPTRLERLARDVRLYRRQLQRFELSDRFVRQGPGGIRLRTALTGLARVVIMAAGGLPAAVVGTIGNVVPYIVTDLCGRSLAPDITKVTTTQLLTGAVAFVTWYAAVVAALYGVVGLLPILLVVAFLPPTGLFTLWYLRWIRYHARHARFLFLAWVEAQEIGKLRAARHAVLEEIDRVRDDVLASGEAAMGPRRVQAPPAEPDEQS
jgi:hypothetical protein